MIKLLKPIVYILTITINLYCDILQTRVYIFLPPILGSISLFQLFQHSKNYNSFSDIFQDKQLPLYT